MSALFYDAERQKSASVGGFIAAAVALKTQNAKKARETTLCEKPTLKRSLKTTLDLDKKGGGERATKRKSYTVIKKMTLTKSCVARSARSRLKAVLRKT